VLFGFQSGCGGGQRCWEIDSSEADGGRVRAWSRNYWEVEMMMMKIDDDDCDDDDTDDDR
jgi:hypothetical protein